jgi:AcrR family transcriptional regulator
MNKDQAFRDMISTAGTTREKLFLSAVWLFSVRGSSQVGIRELCRSVGIKESSFYNHFSSKESLLEEIFNFYVEAGQKMVLTEEEIEELADLPDLDRFFARLMDKFGLATRNPLFFTVLQVLTVEGFTNRKAFEIARRNLYYLRREYTEKALLRLRQKGFIRDCDIPLITAEYYYGLKGLLDEYLLLELWNEDTSEIYQKIIGHVRFFVTCLEP